MLMSEWQSWSSTSKSFYLPHLVIFVMTSSEKEINIAVQSEFCFPD